MPRCIGGTDDEHSFIFRFGSIHFAEELIDQIPSSALAEVFSIGGECIHFIEEENARCVLPCLLEDFMHVFLGVSDPHIDDLVQPETDKISLDFTRRGFADQGLAAAGRSVKKHTTSHLFVVGFE